MTMDNLAKDAFLAIQNGMSYGQYMAKFKPPKEPLKKKKAIDYLYRTNCAGCGNEFVQSEKRSRKYCSERCRRKYEYLRKLEKEHGQSKNDRDD